MISNLSWDVYKPEIWIWFNHRLWEGFEEISYCVVTLVIIYWLNGFKTIISRFWWKFGVSDKLMVLDLYKGALRPIEFIPFSFFQGNHLKVLVTVWCFIIIVDFRVSQRGTNAHWVNPLQFYQDNHFKVFLKVWCCRTVKDIILSKYKYSPLVVRTNEYIAAT